MEILYPDMFWKVKIYWSKPIRYERLIDSGSHYDDTAYLYKITGKFCNGIPKLFYIGKTYKQQVSTRLTQADHRNRYVNLSKRHPKHRLYVSLGNVSLEFGIITSRRISDIEQLLIFSHYNDHITNKAYINSHRIKEQYDITNVGYKAPLLSRICLGVFCK